MLKMILLALLTLFIQASSVTLTMSANLESISVLRVNDNGNVFAYSIDDSISETYSIKNVGKVAEVVYFQGSKPEIKTDINQSIYKYAYSGGIK